MAFECRWAELRSAVRLGHGSAATVECRFAWERIAAAAADGLGTNGLASAPMALGDAEPIPSAAAAVYVPVLADVGCCLRASCQVVVCHGKQPPAAASAAPLKGADGSVAEVVEVIGTAWLVSAPVLQAAPFIQALSLHGEPVEGEVKSPPLSSSR